MTFGQFMPVFSPGAGLQKDPYAEYVIMSLRMENNGDGFTLVDDSMHKNTFVRSGDAQLSGVKKKFGKTSAVFDGTGDHYFSAAKPLFNMSGDFTIEFWVNYQLNTASTYSAYLVSHKTTVDWQEPIVAIYRDGRIVYTYNNGNRITSANPINQNEWVHISYGCKDNKHYLHINGVLQGTYTTTSKWTGWSCAIGTSGWQRNTGTIDKFRGYIDEFRWWKGVSIRDGVSNFTPPKAPWSPPHQGIFSPIEIYTGGTPGLGVGYSQTYGSISAQPFAGFTLTGIGAYYENFYRQWVNDARLTGTFTAAEFNRFMALVPELRLRRGSLTKNLRPFTRDASGVISIPTNTFDGTQEMFVIGQTTYLERA